MTALAQLLEEGAFGALTAEQRDTVAQIAATGAQVDQLASDLTDVAALRAGKAPVRIDAVRARVHATFQGSNRLLGGAAARQAAEVRQLVSALAAAGLGEEAVEVERPGAHPPHLPLPERARAVPVDLDAVVVRVAQVDGLADEVVGGARQRHARARRVGDTLGVGQAFRFAFGADIGMLIATAVATQACDMVILPPAAGDTDEPSIRASVTADLLLCR